MPWNAEAWQSAFMNTGLPLALDRFEGEIQLTQAFQWCVLKPAVQEPTEIVRLAEQSGARMIVTSYMDHPLGQVSAAFEASRLAASGIELGACGLLTHFHLVPNAWTETLTVEEARLQAPAGLGFGFDSLLEKEAWDVLR